MGWPGQARPGRPLAFSAIGMSIPSPQPRAFPRISKLFQGNSKLFQGNSKLFQTFPRISKFFSLVVSRKIKDLSLGQPGIAFSPNFRVVSAATSGPAAPCRTRSRFKVARIPIIGKKLSAAISARGLGASAGLRHYGNRGDSRLAWAAPLRWDTSNSVRRLMPLESIALLRNDPLFKSPAVTTCRIGPRSAEDHGAANAPTPSEKNAVAILSAPNSFLVSGLRQGRSASD